MKLYSNDAGEWVGTLAEAKQWGVYRPVDVPTDKPSLLNFLRHYDVGKGYGETPSNAAPDVATKTVVNGWDLKAAADTASLQDLQYVVYQYMMRIDDELDLKKENKA